MDTCHVCGIISAASHGHHTTPQAYGGRNSQIVNLCPTCHNLIHLHGQALLAYLRSGGKTKIKNYYPTAEQEQQALPLVRAIVEGALQENIADKVYNMQLELPEDIYSCLRLLKKDLGLGSLQQALTYCITRVYSERIGEFQTGEKRNEKRRSCHEMWGL